jgi:hypothetical protein
LVVYFAFVSFAINSFRFNILLIFQKFYFVFEIFVFDKIDVIVHCIFTYILWLLFCVVFILLNLEQFFLLVLSDLPKISESILFFLGIEMSEKNKTDIDAL